MPLVAALALGSTAAHAGGTPGARPTVPGTPSTRPYSYPLAVVGGGIAVLGAPIAFLALTTDPCAGRVRSECGAPDRDVPLLLTGLGMVALGVPLAVLGSRRVPVDPPRAALRLEPRSLHLRVRF